MTRESPGALGSIRVLDLSDESGVYGAKLLADLGADVIRLEPPGGDPLRSRPPFLHDQPGPDRSLFFAYMNTSKRSVTLNLATPDGRALFDRLAATADAVYFSGSAVAYDALGLDALAARSPRLVVAAVTPFGLTGPFRDWSGNDLVAWAMGGLAYTLGDPDRPPLIPAPQAKLSAILGSLFAALGTITALRGRARLGRGQRVDISLQESVLMASPESGVTPFLDDMIPRVRAGAKRPMTAPMGHYRTKDGYASVLALMPLHWQALSEWIYEKTGNEAALDESLRGPGVNRSGGNWTVADLFTQDLADLYTKHELFEEGQRRGVAITPVNDPASVADDPQLAERDYWTTIEVDGEPVRAPGPPYRLTGTPWRISRQPPRAGQHNAEVYGELGLDAEELVRLAAAGVV